MPEKRVKGNLSNAVAHHTCLLTLLSTWLLITYILSIIPSASYQTYNSDHNQLKRIRSFKFISRLKISIIFASKKEKVKKKALLEYLLFQAPFFS